MCELPNDFENITIRIGDNIIEGRVNMKCEEKIESKYDLLIDMDKYESLPKKDKNELQNFITKNNIALIIVYKL